MNRLPRRRKKDGKCTEKINGIYSILNEKNGRVYIGKSNDCKKRKRMHFSSLLKGGHHNSEIQKDYNLFGLGAFTFRVLEVVFPDKKEMNFKETTWINRLKARDPACGYNMQNSVSLDRCGFFANNAAFRDRLSPKPS